MGPKLVITADTKQAVAAVSHFQARTQGMLGGVITTANVTGQALKALGASFIGIGAAAAVTYGAVASFNQSLTHVRALGNLTQQEMNNLAASVNRVATEYGVSGDVIADGTVVLAKAGLTIDEINDSIGAMTALSKANSISFEEAANMTVFAVETFHKSYGDVTDLLDKMQVAAQQSILDIGDLQKAFAYAGSTAMMTGVSYEELLSIMAVLSNRALEAGISARSTNKMLLDIVQHAPKLEAFYKKMGKDFEIVEDGTINFSGLVEALSDATINVEFLQGATEIFTVRALRAFGLLAGASGDYADMLDQVNSAQGELDRTVDVQLTALSARLDILKQEMVALIRSPEVMAALDLMIGSIEELARELIPEFVAAMTHATQAFAQMLAKGGISEMLVSLTKILLNFLKVAANLANWLSEGLGKGIISVAIALQILKFASLNYIQTLYTLTQAFIDNFNAINMQNLASEVAAAMYTRMEVLQKTMAVGADKMVESFNNLSKGWVNLTFAGMSVGDVLHRIGRAFNIAEIGGTNLKNILNLMSEIIKKLNLDLGMFKAMLSNINQDMKTAALKANQVAIGFQMAGAAIGNALSMGMMFATMDFSPTVKYLLAIAMIMNVIATAASVYATMMTVAETSEWAGPLALPVALVTAGAMVALAAAVHGEMKNTFQANELSGYDAATGKYAPTADTGMFVGGRRSVYDEGGIAPRHQLVYVEPGEQIISKTQGMVGMGSGVNVYVGDVYTQDGTDFADKLADALPRAMQRASYRGTF